MTPAVSESAISIAPSIGAEPETPSQLTIHEIAKHLGYDPTLVRRVAGNGPYSESDLPTLRLACRKVWSLEFDRKIEIDYRIKYGDGCDCSVCKARYPIRTKDESAVA